MIHPVRCLLSNRAGNIQIPTTKIPNKFWLMVNCLEFGVWELFAICDLKFVISLIFIYYIATLYKIY